MKTKIMKNNKPVSLAGCQQIFKKAGVSFEEYKNLTLFEIFDKAEKIVKEQNIICDEIYVDMENVE